MSVILFQASYTWQNMATDKFDAEFIERRRAALEVRSFFCLPCCSTCMWLSRQKLPFLSSYKRAHSNCTIHLSSICPFTCSYIMGFLSVAITLQSSLGKCFTHSGRSFCFLISQNILFWFSVQQTTILTRYFDIYKVILKIFF